MPPKKAPLAPLDERQRYDVSEAIAYLRTSRFSFYRDVKAGRIQIFKSGARTYISGSEIARLSKAPQQQSAVA
jgi:hypothetical protein